MHRLLVALPAPLPQTLRLEGADFHRVAHVLRLERGANVELFDGRGRAVAAVIEELESAAVVVRLGDHRLDVAEGNVTLLQGLPKGDKWEWVLQKGTELGARRFIPVTAERSIVHLKPAQAAARHARWQKIAEEASRQCGRAEVPELSSLCSLQEALEGLPPGVRLVVLDEQERNVTLRGLLEPLTVPVVFAVGPEGGWSREELKVMKTRGGLAASLGQRVLRTETAAVAALAIAHYLTLPLVCLPTDPCPTPRRP